MNLSTTYIQSLFKKTPKQLCRHALSLDATGEDEFWFVCGVIDAQSYRTLTKLRAASQVHDMAAARDILKQLEAAL